jgi:hypothetical protein
MDGSFPAVQRRKRKQRKLFEFLLEKFPQIKTLVYAINPKPMILFMIWILMCILEKDFNGRNGWSEV